MSLLGMPTNASAPAYCADHYEISAYYSATAPDNDDSYLLLEEALEDTPGVYMTTQAAGGNFTNPDWPAAIGSRRRDRKDMRQQVIALMAYRRKPVKAAVAATADEIEAEVIADLTADEAQALTERIKVQAENLWADITEAYRRRAWAVLGYETWDAYTAAEFGSLRLRLPREERQEIVCSLRESGMPIRAIASATGADAKTVQADLKSPVGNSHTSPTTVTGTDGKKHPAKKPTEGKPEAKKLTAAERKARDEANKTSMLVNGIATQVVDFVRVATEFRKAITKDANAVAGRTLTDAQRTIIAKQAEVLRGAGTLGELVGLLAGFATDSTGGA